MPCVLQYSDFFLYFQILSFHSFFSLRCMQTANFYPPHRTISLSAVYVSICGVIYDIQIFIRYTFFLSFCELKMICYIYLLMSQKIFIFISSLNRPSTMHMPDFVGCAIFDFSTENIFPNHTFKARFTYFRCMRARFHLHRDYCNNMSDCHR